MAYDAAKAHEYYMKYKKKGLKKGRKKGSKKASTKQTNLVGLSNSGLNDQGKMEWAMAKEKLKSDMNAALAKAKTPEEKDKIRREYQAKALEQLKSLKSNASFAQAKKTSSKGSSSKGSSSKGSSSKGSSKSTSSKETSTKSTSAGAGTSTKATTQATTAVQTTQELTQKANAMINELEDKLAKMTPEQREKARDIIQEQINLFKKLLGKG